MLRINKTFALILLLIPILCQGQKKIFIKEYTHLASDFDSKISSRAISLNELRIQLLSEMGVYITSEQILKTSDTNGVFNQDFQESITTLTAGVTELEIIDEKWDGREYWVKASITIDVSTVQQALDALQNDKQKVKEINELKNVLEAKNKELKEIREQLSKVTNEEEKNDLLNQYKEETRTILEANSRLFNEIIEIDKQRKSKIDSISKILTLKPNDSKSLIARGRLYLSVNKPKEAFEDFNKVLNVNESNPMVLYLCGIAKWKSGNTTLALEYINKSISIEENYISYMAKGEIYNEIGYKLSSIDAFTNAISLNSSNPELHLKRGKVLMELQEFDKALNDFTKAIQLDSNNYEGFFLTALIYTQKLEFNDALLFINRSIKLYPENPAAHHSKASILYYLNRKEEACISLKIALKGGIEITKEELNEMCD